MESRVNASNREKSGVVSSSPTATVGPLFVLLLLLVVVSVTPARANQNAASAALRPRTS